MRYTIDINRAGIQETLEFDGVIFERTWTRSEEEGLHTNDKEFNEQLEAAGCRNDNVLDNIYDLFDNVRYSDEMLDGLVGWEEEDA